MGVSRKTGITDAVLEEIRARVELSDLIASYGIDVRMAGASKKACCPFHHEKTPSFNINDSKGFYHCFGCGESGDAIKFVMKMEGLPFADAVKKLAERCGVKIELKDDPDAGKRRRLLALMAELAAFYHRCLGQIREAEGARAYLKSRDLNEQVQEDFLIGYAPRGMMVLAKWAEKHGFTRGELADAGVIKLPDPNDSSDHGYHRFGGRLMFSIRDKRGQVVAFSGRQLVEDKRSGKYVNSPETLIFKKSNVLFGFDKAAGAIARSTHHEVIVCEGQIDTIRLHVSGFPIAVASQGTAFTEEHVRMVKKVADQVTLVFDDDSAGHKATIRTARLFLAAGLPVRTVRLPDGDDPDSFLRRHAAADFQRLLDGAESIMAFQVRAERQKEANPNTLDAVTRVTREIIGTIASAASAVQRVSLLGEAAKLLNLPTQALEDELSNFKATPPTRVQAKPEDPPEVEDEPAEPMGRGAVNEAAREVFSGEDAGASLPPPNLETEFCGFLLSNRHQVDLDGLIGEFLPVRILSHPWTRGFLAAWRAEVASGGEELTAWCQGLDSRAQDWCGGLLAQQEAAGQISEDAVETFTSEYVARLWREHMRRLHGTLPANGSTETDDLRVLYKLRENNFKHLKWDKIKDIIREMIQGGL